MELLEDIDVPATDQWIWPVPTLVYPDRVEYVAKISSGFHDSLRGVAPNQYPHSGSDIMYKRRSLEDRPEYVNGKKGSDGFADASKWYFAPPGTPILAARAGTVRKVYVRSDKGGGTVIIDHGDGLSTYYTHLASMSVKPEQRVAAGKVIGRMGASNKDGSKLRHLHFETRKADKSTERSYDPRPHGEGSTMDWPRATWRPRGLIEAIVAFFRWFANVLVTR